MKFILGKKVSMTQIFSKDGKVVPVTKIEAGPCQITEMKSIKNDKGTLESVQIGFGKKKEWRLKKPIAGHLKGLEPVRWLKSFTLSEKVSAKKGDVISVGTFEVGDKVTIIGTSKGKGFAGVVKRHHFRGGPASHGHKDNLRMPGSIGAGGVQRVFKGMRMAGRMGGDRVTVKNLEIIEIDAEKNIVYIKGAVPGAANGLLLISAEGNLKVLDETPVVENTTTPEVNETVESNAPETEIVKTDESVKNEDVVATENAAVEPSLETPKVE
jgi:large subunit ribosomal protein L3